MFFSNNYSKKNISSVVLYFPSYRIKRKGFNLSYANAKKTWVSELTKWSKRRAD